MISFLTLRITCSVVNIPRPYQGGEVEPEKVVKHNIQIECGILQCRAQIKVIIIGKNLIFLVSAVLYTSLLSFQ